MHLLLLSFLKITSAYLCQLPLLASEEILNNYASSDLTVITFNLTLVTFNLTLAIFDFTLVTNLQSPDMRKCI